MAFLYINGFKKYRVFFAQGKAVKFEEDPDTNPDGSPKKKPPPPESERRKLTRQESKAQMDMLSSRDDFEDNLRTIFHKYLPAPANALYAVMPLR